MKKLLQTFIFCLLTSSIARADFLIDLNTGYQSNTDGNTKYTFSDLTNHVFFGASIGSKDQLYIGQNVTHQSRQYKTTTTTKISTLELGPRMLYYFNGEKTVLFTLGWNPYAKGSRTTLTGANQDVSGWSLLTGLGCEVKINRNFHIGGSIMYHNLKITESVVNNISTEVTESYSSITPMINLSFRFR